MAMGDIFLNNILSYPDEKAKKFLYGKENSTEKIYPTRAYTLFNDMSEFFTDNLDYGTAEFIERIDLYLRAVEKAIILDEKKARECLTYSFYTGQTEPSSILCNGLKGRDAIANANSTIYVTTDVVSYYALMHSEQYPNYCRLIKDFSNSLFDDVIKNNKDSTDTYNQSGTYRDDLVSIYPTSKPLETTGIPIRNYTTDNHTLTFCSQDIKKPKNLYFKVSLIDDSLHNIDYLGGPFCLPTGVSIRCDSDPSEVLEADDCVDFLTATIRGLLTLLLHNKIRVKDDWFTYPISKDGTIELSENPTKHPSMSITSYGIGHKNHHKVVYFATFFEKDSPEFQKFDEALSKCGFDSPIDIPIALVTAEISLPHTKIPDYSSAHLYTMKICMPDDNSR